MIFRLGQNKYAVLMNVSSDEKVFLELEKIRKAVSSKIYNTEGKEISYTVSFAIKKYDDMNLSRQAFLKELNDLLELAGSEGGNCVKI
jgi:GGDEF domain-containing protein